MEVLPPYVAGDENAKAGVLIVHDWFGVSPFYLEAVERLADKSYAAPLGEVTLFDHAGSIVDYGIVGGCHRKRDELPK